MSGDLVITPTRAKYFSAQYPHGLIPSFGANFYFRLVANQLIENCKPFLKWAGGKTQLLRDIERSLPEDIYHWKEFTYIEPFAGSGAVLFWMLRKFPNLKRAVINDINEELMTAYAVVKKEPLKLIKELNSLQKKYYAIESEENRSEFFYLQRDRFNSQKTDNVKSTTLLIFLNRTCFNGLYRVNSKGEFNVPFGRYTKPTICDEQTILADSVALQNVELLTGDFEQTLPYAKGEETLFYFDPPYKPLSETSHFTAYAKGVFNDAEQERLKKFCDLVNMKGYSFILSNSDVNITKPGNKYFDHLYSDFNIERVYAKRSINANAEKRGTLKELLITNYAQSKTTHSIRA